MRFNDNAKSARIKGWRLVSAVMVWSRFYGNKLNEARGGVLQGKDYSGKTTQVGLLS